MKKEDNIQKEVGFVFYKKVGDIVKKGEVLGYVHANEKDKTNEVINQQIYEIV